MLAAVVSDPARRRTGPAVAARTLDHVTPASLADAVRRCLPEAVEAGDLAVDVPAAVHGRAPPQPRARRLGDQRRAAAGQAGRAARRARWPSARRAAARRSPGVKGVDVAGPGFLNITLDAAAAGALARTIVEAGRGLRPQRRRSPGRGSTSSSSRPTRPGPIHLGGVRWAAVGDSLARVLQASGRRGDPRVLLQRPRRPDRPVRALAARPREGRAGARGRLRRRLHRRHRRAGARRGARRAGAARRRGAGDVPARGRRPDVRRDQGRACTTSASTSTSTSTRTRCTTSGAVERARRAAARAGPISTRRTARVWLRTTDFGDDKDRVVIKSDGEPTYFAGDLAYYLDKRERGFDRVIIMLGADHHGYVGRHDGDVRRASATTPEATSRSSSARWSTCSRTASRCG